MIDEHTDHLEEIHHETLAARLRPPAPELITRLRTIDMHADALAAERDALAQQVAQLVDLLRMTGELYNVPSHSLEAMIKTALDVHAEHGVADR